MERGDWNKLTDAGVGVPLRVHGPVTAPAYRPLGESVAQAHASLSAIEEPLQVVAEKLDVPCPRDEGGAYQNMLHQAEHLCLRLEAVLRVLMSIKAAL